MFRTPVLMIWLLLLFLCVIYVSHSQIRRAILEPFFDMTSTTALNASKDFQNFLSFHNNQFCPIWNQVIDAASKNDQLSLPAEQQVGSFAYMQQMQKAWNETQSSSVTFVNCSVPIDSGIVPRTLLQIMPTDGQPYVDTLTFMNTKMDLIQKQVQEAVSGIDTGTIPEISTESFIDSKKVQVTCIIEDDGTMNCSDRGNSVSCTNSAPLTPEQLKVQEGQVQQVIQRAKTINATIPNLKPQLAKASASVTSLNKTVEDAKSGALYGVKETPSEPLPVAGHLFFDRY